MNLADAAARARTLLQEHGLTAQGWTFAYDNAKARFGQCRYADRTITLSRPITRLNEEHHIRTTLLHEIAHALAGPGTGHGPVWRRTARKLGIRPDRCYDPAKVRTPPAPYTGTCPTPSCGATIKRHRLTTKARNAACGACCKRYNNGWYHPNYRLHWKRTDT